MDIPKNNDTAVDDSIVLAKVEGPETASDANGMPIAAVARGTETALLLALEDIEDWQKLEANPHILHGYRRASGSLKECLRSWTYLHNDTVNIFSHIAGFVVFFALPIWLFTPPLSSRYPLATPADKAVCSIFFVGVMLCFLLSSTYHTILCHSARLCALGLQLDYMGIVLLMCGANIPLIHYSFPCSQSLRTIYFVLITVLSALCAATTFHPRFRQPQLEPVRAAVFGAVVVATFIPIVHGFVREGAAEQFDRVALPGVLGTLGFNVLGGVVYAAKVPERWWPGRFDVWGSSHQLMHVAVLLASGSYVAAVVGEFDYFHAHPDQCVG